VALMTDDLQQTAEEGVARMLAADDASRRLGIEVSGVAPGRATARMRIDATMINGHGMAHGGYVFLLADTAFAAACNTYGLVTVARSADITFVSSAKEGDELEATAVERGRHGRNGIYDVAVVRPGDGQVVAEFRGQSRTLDQRLVEDPPGS
jgi:acyl-CoA thioesterase